MGQLSEPDRESVENTFETISGINAHIGFESDTRRRLEKTTTKRIRPLADPRGTLQRPPLISPQRGNLPYYVPKHTKPTKRHEYNQNLEPRRLSHVDCIRKSEILRLFLGSQTF